MSRKVVTSNVPAACDICQSRSFGVVSPGSEKENDLVQCGECGHLYLHPFPTPEYLKQAYAEELSINESPEAMDRQQFLWQRRYRSVRQKWGSGRGALLDVGCGEGWFLREAQADGWVGFGTEYHDEAAKYAREKFRLDVFGGDLIDARFSSEKFGAVTLWHVLEHLYSPSNYLKEIHRVLKPGGRLLVECPHIDATHVLPGTQNGYRRLHLHFFSRPAMVRLLQQGGFTVEQSTYEDPDAYKRVWSSILHHHVRSAFLKMAGRLTSIHWGSTIRVYAKKRRQ